MDVQRALRPARRARRVGEEVRRLRVDLERRRALPARARPAIAAVAAPTRPRAAPSARRARPRPRSGASVRACRAGRSGSAQMSDLRLRVLRAAAAIAGAAKPEKIGTCTAPMCAHACDATAAAGRHRHEDRHAVAGLDAELHERLREPRHLRRELRERPARAGRRSRRGARLRQRRASAAPSRGRTPVRRSARPPTNQVAHSGPLASVEHALPRLRELDAEIVDDRGPESLGILDRDSDAARGNPHSRAAASGASRLRARRARQEVTR